MISTNLVSSIRLGVNENLYSENAYANKTYSNCQIAKDAAKKLDFLILVIETLQINATDALFLRAKNIGLPFEYSSRVEFWKIRCTNPLRKAHTFVPITNNQVDALVKLISTMAESLYPLIRQLLSSKEPEGLNDERWVLFSTRLKSLIKDRMNLKRCYISTLVNDKSNAFFRELLVILALASGPGGYSRLKASLYYQN